MRYFFVALVGCLLNSTSAYSACQKVKPISERCSIETCRQVIFKGDQWWKYLCEDNGICTYMGMVPTYGPYQEANRKCYCPCSFDYLGD